MATLEDLRRASIRQAVENAISHFDQCGECDVCDTSIRIIRDASVEELDDAIASIPVRATRDGFVFGGSDVDPL